MALFAHDSRVDAVYDAPSLARGGIMTVETVKDRCETNLLYNYQNLKLGTFSTDLVFVGTLTRVTGRIRPRGPTS